MGASFGRSLGDTHAAPEASCPFHARTAREASLARAENEARRVAFFRGEATSQGEPEGFIHLGPPDLRGQKKGTLFFL